MAEIGKKTKRYPTDLAGEEWSRIAPLLPPPSKTGRKRNVGLREILNAIRYMARSGGGWRSHRSPPGEVRPHSSSI